MSMTDNRPAGRPKVVETEEFKEAVSAQVASQVQEQLAALEERLAARGAPPPTAAPAGPGSVERLLTEVLEQLSVNMGAIASQGERRRPLAPEEVKRRAMAEKRMEDLVVDARSLPREHWPLYRLTSKVCLQERLIEPFKTVDKRPVPNEVLWTGVPNDAMVPLNEAARHIFDAWREYTGGRTELVPTADRRPLFTTPAGLVVRGDPPARRFVAAEPEFADGLVTDNSDPNSAEVAVLGTVAPRAKRNLAGVHQQPTI